MTQNAKYDVMDEYTILGRYAIADISELCIWIFIIEDRMHRLLTLGMI